VKGRPGKENKRSGEIWDKDTFHRSHWEVYKNLKNYENGIRDRSGWNNGRLKQKF
jgi:hypothetical protein